MSTHPRDEMFRCRDARTRSGTLFVSLAIILAAGVLVGCGGSTDQSGPADDGPTATSESETGGNGPATPPSGDGSAGSAATDASTTQSDSVGPDSGAGLQLPDDTVPDATVPGEGTPADDGSGGPAKPGDGGIEMPELNAPANKVPANADPADSSGPVGATDVDLKFASWKEIESHAKTTGKITVVDLWSTVCEPCVKEFPGLVRLSKTMTDQVTCIGVSVDYDGRKTRPPESYADRVGAFLGAVGAEFDNFVCNTPSDDVYSTVGLPSIPAVLIYNEKGELVKQFVDSGDTIGFSYEKDIIPFVESLAG